MNNEVETKAVKAQDVGGKTEGLNFWPPFIRMLKTEKDWEYFNVPVFWLLYQFI